MNEAVIETSEAKAYSDFLRFQLQTKPKPNGRLKAQNKLAYPNFNT